MQNKKQIKILLLTMMFLLKIFGLFTIRYTNESKKFVTSTKQFTYCLLIALSLTIIYSHQIYRDYVTGHINFRDAPKLYGYLNFIGAFINYVSQIFLTKKLVFFFNNVPLYKTIDYFAINGKTIRKAFWLTLVKTIIFPLLIEGTLIIKQKKEYPERNFIWTLYILLPLIVCNILNNCFFGAMLLVKPILVALNIRLQLLAKTSNYLETQSLKEHKNTYYTIQQCNMSDVVDELAIKYATVCLQSNEYTHFTAFSLISSFLTNLFGITVGFFNQYTAIADTLINEETYDPYNALLNSIFLIISFFEIAMISRLCNDILIETKKTGFILHTINLQRGDIRFKQSVESFSMQVFTINHKIMPLGMLEINVTLVSNVLSAVTSFLLILIQSDLTLRFSLK